MPTTAAAVPRISERARKMPASPIRRLMPLAEAARARGVHVYHLNIGQPDIETPACMREKLAQAERVFAYSPSGGTPEYVASLSTYYAKLGFTLGPEQLLATTGGSEALLFALFACTEAGDEAILVEPFYTNYNSFAGLAGVTLRPVKARGEDGFHLPPDAAFEAVLSPRTRVFLLCNPSNPTGTVYTREEVERVGAFCRRHGLFLISDEVYREFVYDGRVATSALSLPDSDDFVIVVDSLSKRYSACGIRLGCMATRNRDVHSAALRMAQGRLSPPGLAQLVALGASEVGPEYVAGVQAEYQKRRDVLFEGLGRIPGVFLAKPEGAFYFVARLPVADADDFAAWLLSDFSHEGATVMVAPASGFYATPGLGKDEVRIAYVLNVDDLRASIKLLELALQRYREQRGLGQDQPSV